MIDPVTIIIAHKKLNESQTIQINCISGNIMYIQKEDIIDSYNTDNLIITRKVKNQVICESIINCKTIESIIIKQKGR